MTRELTEAILAEVPEAEIEAVEGDEGVLTVESFFAILQIQRNIPNIFHLQTLSKWRSTGS